jgi:hypothetical protein
MKSIPLHYWVYTLSLVVILGGASCADNSVDGGGGNDDELFVVRWGLTDTNTRSISGTISRIRRTGGVDPIWTGPLCSSAAAGKILLGTTDIRVVMYDLVGGRVERVMGEIALNDSLLNPHTVLLPDHDRVVTTIGVYPTRIYSASLSSPETPHLLVSSMASSLAYKEVSRNGRMAAVYMADSLAIFDLVQNRLVSVSTVIPTTTCCLLAYRPHSTSDDGRLVAIAQQGMASEGHADFVEVIDWERNSREVVFSHATHQTPRAIQTVLSRDGQKIVINCVSQIWMIDLVSKSSRMLLENPLRGETYADVQWSPDGSKVLVLQRYRNSTDNLGTLYAVDIDSHNAHVVHESVHHFFYSGGR